MKLCEENAQVWTELIEDLEMKDVEAKLREAQEHAQQGSRKGGYTTTDSMHVSHSGSMTGTVEVEKMRDQQNILQQRLGPLQEEVVWVIEELDMVQGRVKKETMEAEDKLTNLTMQGEEEITTTEAEIIKEVEGEKEASQMLDRQS
jgi:hypothetical protein